MTREDATKLLINFIHEHLHARRSSSCFYLIDGDNICARCRSSKKRKLYMIISDDMPIMLKCFRASCSSDYSLDHPEVDVNRARCITEDELLKFGFTNKEAIKSLLNTSNLVHKKSRTFDDESMFVINSMLTIEQKTYILKRCNFVPFEKDMDKYHIVSDVNEMVTINSINIPNTMKNIYSSFSTSNALTFMCGNVTLSTRAIDETPVLQKSIMNVTENARSIGYYIGNEIHNKKVLIMSEGIFDIINIERYFATDIPNALYVATLGLSKFVNLIEYYYYQNIEEMKTLILFVDSDVKYKVGDRYKYTYNRKQLFNLIKNVDLLLGIEAFNDIFICYNTVGKDCGDLSKKIRMTKEKLDKLKLYKEFEFKKYKGRR